jgi:uncharacterized Fe-S cluster-containing MiaB family protein
MARNHEFSVFISTGNPEEVIESCASRDFARLRAAKLARKMDTILYVWTWNPETRLRYCFSHAAAGLVFWRKPCKWCDARGCDFCLYLGSQVDVEALPERESDAI